MIYADKIRSKNKQDSGKGLKRKQLVQKFTPQTTCGYFRKLYHQRNVQENESVPGGTFLQTTGRAAHFKNIKPHNQSTENWCIPEDMEEGHYMTMDPACEVNVKSTRETNDGNEALEEGTSPPLDLDPNGFPRTGNRIYPFRCKQDKVTRQDPQRNITLTETTS